MRCFLVAMALSVGTCAAAAPLPSALAPLRLVPVMQSRDLLGEVLVPHIKTVVRFKLAHTRAALRVQKANNDALYEPTSDDYLNAVQIYPYVDSALYRLYAAPQKVSDIALEPGETLFAISAGDTVRWTVGDTFSGSGTDRRVHILVKPFAANLKTNLVILTDKHAYHLELQSTDHVFMAAVAWRYPTDGLISSKDAKDPTPTGSGVAIESLNFGYTISGDSVAWKPLRAFDDGAKVYIEFPNGLDVAPPLFVIDEAGGHDLVNYRVVGNYYVVDRLFGTAELRLGQDNQKVVRISRNQIGRSR